jgi:hypothetical protein
MRWRHEPPEERDKRRVSMSTIAYGALTRKRDEARLKR